MTPNESWFGIDLELRRELDPILSDYEIARRNGEHPDRAAFLRRCSSRAGRLLLEKEFEFYDRYYEEQAVVPATEISRGPLITLPDYVGRFQVISFVARGAFSHVYLAWDHDGDRRVALKITDLSGGDDEARICCERESAALSRLDSPRVVRWIESFQEGQLHVCVTEWIDGVTMHRALQDSNVPIPVSTSWLADVAEGLHHVHQRGILHRDIKPENVMIDRHSRAVIFDFGLCRFLKSSPGRNDSDRSRAGQLKGSISYMSPEQARGDVDLLDGRSDIFSLGIVMFEALAGHRPWSSEADKALAQIVNGELPNLRAIRPGLPRELERICRKSIQRKPVNRYQTADQMRADLTAWHKRCARRHPGEAIAANAFATRRRSIPFVAVAVSTLFLLAASVLAWYAWRSGRESGMAHSAKANADQPDSEWTVPPPLMRPVAGDQVRVMIKSEPGAQLVFVPLNGLGQPVVDQAIFAGASPARLNLAPNSYLVIAMSTDGRFHEVVRRVPLHEETPRLFPHHSWVRTANYVRLPDVSIVDPDYSKMVQVDGLWIDRSEYHGPPNSALRSGFGDLWSATDTFANTTYDHAMEHLERTGKRLPFLYELVTGLDSELIHNESDSPEWTMSPSSFRAFATGNPQRFWTWAASYKCVRTRELNVDIGEGIHCEFRGVRSHVPLVVAPR